jgi:hypothetical protein
MCENLREASHPVMYIPSIYIWQGIMHHQRAGRVRLTPCR